MNKLFISLILLASIANADDAYFKFGPFELTVPFKTADVVYLYDGINSESLVGGETTIARGWDKVSATIGVVTSLSGNGTPYCGADLDAGSILQRYVNLGNIRIGGWGGRNFREGEWSGGLKASTKLW